MRDTERPGRGARATTGGALLGLAAGLSACNPAPDEDATIELVQVERDLLADPPEWDVRRAHPERAPEVAVICPTLRSELDGADLLALVMPPPCEVRFTIDADVPPSFLRLRAGMDLTVAQRFGERASGRFLFEVLVDGRSVYRSARRPREGRGSAWEDVGGERGLAVRPGSEVTLITSAELEEGDPVDYRPVDVGFGGLRLETRTRRARERSSLATPNVVLVVLDTLRADRLSCYGYRRRTSPNLDRLAERGTLFEEAYATSSWTWPSTASILTGLAPEEHGVRRSDASFLAWNVETLAETLQRAGLTTAAWSANPLVSASRNFDQGFESFEDGLEMRLAGDWFERVRAFLWERAGTRFFLYMHLVEPHRPFRPLPEAKRELAPEVPQSAVLEAQRIATLLGSGGGYDERGRSLLEELVTAREREHVDRLYDACVWSADHWIGELVDELEGLRLLEETIVVVTADHGEELFERSYLGHSKTVHAELVRAPLVMAGPGLPEGLRVAGAVSNRELTPFLATLVGAGDAHGSYDVEAFLAGRAQRPVTYSTELGFWNGRSNVPIRGLRWGDYGVQLAPGGTGWGGRGVDDLRLFHLGRDPGEREDLSGRPGEPWAQARAALERTFEGLRPRFERRDYGAGSATTLMLERLGYAGH